MRVCHRRATSTILKRLISFTLVLLLAEGINSDTKPIAAFEHKFAVHTSDEAATASKIAVHGRSPYTDKGLKLIHPASGITFAGEMQGDVELELQIKFKGNYNHMYFTVLVDGQRQGQGRENSLELTDGKQNSDGNFKIKLASNLPRGRHKISFFRQNEIGFGDIFLKKLKFNGRLSVLPPQTRIEFVGDSITAGFGIYPPSKDYPMGDPYQQDATGSYAFLTSQKLNLDCSLLAISGYGLISGWGNDHTMPKLYPFTDWFKDATASGLYHFKPAADVVCVNLGTNDWNTRSTEHTIKESSSNFYMGVVNFTNLIRQYNPQAKIVWLYGMMIEVNPFEYQIEAAVRQLGGDAANVYSLRLPSGRNGLLGHPDETEQRAAADKLAEFLQEIGVTSGTLSPAGRKGLRVEASAAESLTNVLPELTETELGAANDITPDLTAAAFKRKTVISISLLILILLLIIVIILVVEKSTKKQKRHRKLPR